MPVGCDYDLGDRIEMKFTAPKPSPVANFREKWKKKGIELIDITKLCKIEINCHGSCNDINEPEESIYHIKIFYRDEIIVQIKEGWEVMDDDLHVVYFDKCDWESCKKHGQDDEGFIIFRKVKTK